MAHLSVDSHHVQAASRCATLRISAIWGIVNGPSGYVSFTGAYIHAHVLVYARETLYSVLSKYTESWGALLNVRLVDAPSGVIM